MGNQPVYRRPRSHAYSCRCARCAQRSPGTDVAGAFWGAVAFLAVAFWPEWALHGRASVIAGAIWWGTIAAFGIWVLAAYAAGKRRRAPVVTRPSVAEAVKIADALRDEPPAPVCYHLDAVPVDNLDPDAPPWAWLCPDPPQGCGTQLPAEFGRLIRPCCATPPGTSHLYDCPHRKGGPRWP